MSNPLISVVVPIYNVDKYLDRCVDSIIKQTYTNLEIILVDDGSSDNSPKMCDDWNSRDKRIKVIHKENGGLSDARNAGMIIATGEIISFIDSDDWIEHEMFEKMLNRKQKDNSDIVSCGVKWVKEDGSIIRDVTSDNEIIDTTTAMKELINDNKLKQHVWNKIYNRNLIKDIPFEKGKYHEDVFWSYQIFGKAKRTSVIKESFYNYVQRSNSIMGEEYSAKRLDALDAMKLRCEYIKRYFPELYDNALYVYIGSCHYQLQSAIRTNQSKDIIEKIKYRTYYRTTGHPTRELTMKQKFWYYMFTYIPMTTCRLRNRLGIGL